MSKILSVKIPRKQFSSRYANSLNEIVKETLAGFCTEGAHSFCDKEIDFARSLSGKFFKMEWSADGEPLLLSDEQLTRMKKNMAELPIDAVLFDDNSVSGGAIHSNLNKRWTREMGDEKCVPMDGYYMTTDEPIEQEVLNAYGIKPCNCIKRLPGEHVYCIPYDFSVLSLLKVGKYVSLISSTIISYSNLQLSQLEYVLKEAPSIDFGKIKVSDGKYTVNDALDFRFELTTRNIGSMMVQDFDGTYYVLYNGESEITYDGSTSCASPEIEFSISDLIGIHGEHLLALTT